MQPGKTQISLHTRAVWSESLLITWAFYSLQAIQRGINHSSSYGTFFNPKVLIFFLFVHKNICCGYSLEVPRWGASNEYPQHMFSWRHKTIIELFGRKTRLIWNHEADNYRSVFPMPKKHTSFMFLFLTSICPVAYQFYQSSITAHLSGYGSFQANCGRLEKVAYNVYIDIFLNPE